MSDSNQQQPSSEADLEAKRIEWFQRVMNEGYYEYGFNGLRHMIYWMLDHGTKV